MELKQTAPVGTDRCGSCQRQRGTGRHQNCQVESCMLAFGNLPCPSVVSILTVHHPCSHAAMQPCSHTRTHIANTCDSTRLPQDTLEQTNGHKPPRSESATTPNNHCGRRRAYRRTTHLTKSGEGVSRGGPCVSSSAPSMAPLAGCLDGRPKKEAAVPQNQCEGMYCPRGHVLVVVESQRASAGWPATRSTAAYCPHEDAQHTT